MNSVAADEIAARLIVKEVLSARDVRFLPDLQLFAGAGKGFYWAWAQAMWPALTRAQRAQVLRLAGPFFLSRVKYRVRRAVRDGWRRA